jgi:peroxiredoxin
MPGPAHRVGTREEWLAARIALLEHEKEHTRRSDELAGLRGELPWVPVEEEYRFDTEDGSRTLAELFDGRPELIVYHFMYGPNEPDGCPGCTFAADNFAGAAFYLAQLGVTFMCASRASLEDIVAYKARQGWTFPWVSSAGSSFNRDFGAFPGFDLGNTARPRPRHRLQLRHPQARGRARPAQDRAHGPELLRDARRRRAPHLLGLRPRHRRAQPDVAAARSHAERPRSPRGLSDASRADRCACLSRGSYRPLRWSIGELEKKKNQISNAR